MDPEKPLVRQNQLLQFINVTCRQRHNAQRALDPKVVRAGQKAHYKKECQMAAYMSPHMLICECVYVFFLKLYIPIDLRDMGKNTPDLTRLCVSSQYIWSMSLQNSELLLNYCCTLTLWSLCAGCCIYCPSPHEVGFLWTHQFPLKHAQ